MKHRVAALLLGALIPLAQAEDCAQRYGWKERVRVETLTRWLELDAKLDTGADGSSLHAGDIEVFEREEQNWVRFRLGGQTLEQPVVRRVRIKQKDAEPQERWVVTLDLCVGQTAMQADFSLADRSHFDSAVLLGRDVLEQLGAVDPSMRYTVAPDCRAALEPLIEPPPETEPQAPGPEEMPAQ